MESPNIFHHARGFTLIEILISISITIVILGFGLFVSLDMYKGYTFRSERAVLLSVLERTRSKALANLYESKYGVCLVGSEYIIFRGQICDSTLPENERIPANSSVSVVGIEASTPIIFDQLTGKLLPQVSKEDGEFVITLDDSVHLTQYIKINNEGTINW